MIAMLSTPLLVMAFFLARRTHHPSRSSFKAFLTAFGVLAAYFFGTILALAALALAGVVILELAEIDYRQPGPNNVISKGLVGVVIGGVLGALAVGWRQARNRLEMPPKS